MGMKKHKSHALRRLFMQYVFYLGVLLLTLVFSYYLIFGVASVGVYPANYSETVIQNNHDILEKTPKVTMDLLTPMSHFGVYSKEGDFLYGNLPSKYVEASWDSYTEDRKTIAGLGYFTVIEREHEILIISYPLNMQFKNEGLRSILPNAELTVIFSFLVQLVIVIILWSRNLANRVNKELETLLYTVEMIEQQNLEFDVGESNIKEINRVLQGIDTMKNSLRTSLEEQWRLEKKKKDQIAALAHDLRTPLTIAKGNVQLLQEAEITGEQEEYSTYIEKSTLQMEEYVQRLLLITKSTVDEREEDTRISIRSFIESLKNQGEAFGKAKNIRIVCDIKMDKDDFIRGNDVELERAFMNINTNAISYSPDNGVITLDVCLENDVLVIEIKDQGKGFSEKILKYGKEQFFMDDESRTEAGHHGLGLYIANSIIKNYKGELILSNSIKGGAVVKVVLPQR